MTYPLVFEPGEGWAYGAGLDWAGKAVERLNGNIGLGEYMKIHIWEPLGMNSTTFRLSENESMRERLAKLTARLPSGALTAAEAPFWPEADVPDDCGGSGLFSCASDYIKVLASILKNDGKVLKPESVSKMFEPQLPDPKYIEENLEVPEWQPGFTLGSPVGKKWNHGLGGMLAMEDQPGQLSSGTIFWGGLPNLAWVGSEKISPSWASNSISSRIRSADCI